MMRYRMAYCVAAIITRFGNLTSRNMERISRIMIFVLPDK
jgi:hypothetical protein